MLDLRVKGPSLEIGILHTPRPMCLLDKGSPGGVGKDYIPYYFLYVKAFFQGHQGHRTFPRRWRGLENFKRDSGNK